MAVTGQTITHISIGNVEHPIEAMSINSSALCSSITGTDISNNTSSNS